MDASRMLQKPDSDQRKHTAPYRIKITTKVRCYSQDISLV